MMAAIIAESSIQDICDPMFQLALMATSSDGNVLQVNTCLNVINACSAHTQFAVALTACAVAYFIIPMQRQAIG